MSSSSPARVAVILSAMILAAACAAQTAYPPYWRTPHSKVDVMLELAAVGKDDVVYDLGSGDGRIVIAAAAKYGARGVGVELNPTLIEESERIAREAGVSDRVRFVQEDFYETDISEASVVTLYLFEETNARLKPIFVEQLAPGTRIVTYKYEIPGWTPVKTGKRVFLYALPGAEEYTPGPTSRCRHEFDVIENHSFLSPALSMIDSRSIPCSLA